jgi:hypothetical protein
VREKQIKQQDNSNKDKTSNISKNDQPVVLEAEYVQAKHNSINRIERAQAIISNYRT